MKVHELIEKLLTHDPEALVVCQEDPEGNGHSPLSNMWVGSYTPETTWHGEAHLLELTPELKKAGFGEEDVRTPNGETVKALFLVPVN